jgi:hypothetical protein
MPIYLRNNILKVEIGEPGELYTGSRFDHSGNVHQIILKKRHSFCSTEKTEYSPIHGFGLLNEFDINNPAGYSDVGAGEIFSKIGVGSLLKEDQQPYCFLYDYKKINLEFKVVSSGETYLEFSTKSPLVAGIQTLYKKELSISGNTLIIDYFLKNIGEKNFITEEYCHNFLAIDHQDVGGNYQLDFDFVLQPDLFSEFLNPGGIVNITQNSISWKNKPSTDFFIAGLSSIEQSKVSWKLTNKREKVGVSEQTDFKSERINLWGTGHVICPEIFHQISLSPGEENSWQRIYTFFEI